MVQNGKGPQKEVGPSWKQLYTKDEGKAGQSTQRRASDIDLYNLL